MDFHIIRSPENRPYVIIFGAVSLAFILYGIYCFFSAVVMEKRCTSTAEGTVTYVERNYIKGSSSSFSWTVSFTADGGREYTFDVKRTDTYADKGGQCTVFYDPAKPRNAYVKEAPPDRGLPWVVSGAGFAVIAYIVLFFRQNGQKLFLDR